jgi:hypothetical protein
MNYAIGFDGVLSPQMGRLLQSIERGVNGLGMYAQTSGDTGASAVAHGSMGPCPSGEICSHSVKGGHDFVVVVVVAIVAGAAAGFVAGRMGARSVKGGHD